MSSTYTFTSENKAFQCTVKSEFLKNVAEPEKVPFNDLMTSHQLPSFLHNPKGPAMVILKNGHEEFWLDGKRLSDEAAEKLKHDINFSGKLEDILNSDD